MYRRRRRRRSSGFARRPIQSITHNPGVVNQSITSNTITAKVFLNGKITGQARTTDTNLSDRNTEVSSGSKVNSIVFNISAQMESQTLDEINGGLLSFVVVKRTQSPTVPVAADIDLAEVTGTGMQSTARQTYPGRVLKYGQVAISQALPKAFSFKVNLSKFRMANIRQGDFVVIYYHWISQASIPAQGKLVLSTEARYKEYM